MGGYIGVVSEELNARLEFGHCGLGCRLRDLRLRWGF